MKRGTFSSFALVGAAALPALLGLVLLTAQAPPAPLDERLAAAEAAPPAIYARFVCSFANDDAKGALVQGADGGLSVVASGRSYWFFGDTLFLPESGKQIEQNAVAWSDAQDAAGCPRLTYHARDGIAVPFLPKDGSLTAWPLGAIATDDGAIDFYTVYVYGSGPYAYWIGEVGLAHLDPRTMQASILERRLWTAESGFPSQVISAQPIDAGPEGLLRVVLEALDGSRYLARVPRHGMRAAVAYEIWTGDGWSSDPARAAALWPVRAATTPVERLSLFESSAHIAWNARLQKYVALTNAGYDKIGGRTADRLEGPWSDPQPWLDCKAITQVTVPVCYSALQHPQFASADGRTQYITFTRMASYDVVAYEVTPGTPVHEYRDGGGTVAYATAAPGDGWADQGAAFYAADAPLPGFEPVYRWSRGDETAYAASLPGEDFSRAEIAFYAPLTPPPAGVVAPMRPVFAWRDGTTYLLATDGGGLEAYGFTRGEIAFYAP